MSYVSITSSVVQITSSYISQSNVKIDSNGLYVLSNSGSWWKISVYEDGDHLGTLQIEGPY